MLNPDYERVSVDATVKFRKGKSVEFYKKQLTEEITQFLSPWAFGEGEEESLVFGGTIFKSSIVNFIEKRSYVDYITSFTMKKDNEDPKIEISASKARAILISGIHTIMDPDKACCEGSGRKLIIDDETLLGKTRFTDGGVLKFS